MRHKNNTKTLDRKVGPRTALIKNLAGQVVIYEKVKTGAAKAKVIKSYVEKLITKSKKNDLATRRYLMTKLNHKTAIKKLLEVYGPKFKDVKGGYLRIVKDDKRRGDGAEMVYLEIIK